MAMGGVGGRNEEACLVMGAETVLGKVDCECGAAVPA